MDWSRKFAAALVLIIIFACAIGYFSQEWVVNTNDEKPPAKQTFDYTQWLAFQSNVDKQFNTIPFRHEFINVFGAAQNALQRKYIEDPGKQTVVKLNNDYLTFIDERPADPQVIKNLLKFNRYLKNLGIPLLYVQAPYKINKYDPQLPAGVIEYGNQNADETLAALSKAGIDVLDLRTKINDSNLDHYSLFFKTDHHWLPEAGLWAFGQVGERLNKRYDFQIPKKYFDANNYEYRTYEDWFLGSIGKRMGVYYGGVDDFTIITPKFETNLTFHIPKFKVLREGSFEKTVFNFDKLEKDYFTANVYATYTGGDPPLNTIFNNQFPQGKSALLLRDSFACPFSPFLALGCSRLDVVDLRRFKSSLLNYIEKIQPDVVIIMYNAVMYSDMRVFTFE